MFIIMTNHISKKKIVENLYIYLYICCYASVLLYYCFSINFYLSIHLKKRKKILRIEKMGMANKRIPTKRGIQINETLQLVLVSRNPSEQNHNSFEVGDLFSSPVDTTTTTTTPHSSLKPLRTIISKREIWIFLFVENSNSIQIRG